MQSNSETKRECKRGHRRERRCMLIMGDVLVDIVMYIYALWLLGIGFKPWLSSLLLTTSSKSRPNGVWCDSNIDCLMPIYCLVGITKRLVLQTRPASYKHQNVRLANVKAMKVYIRKIMQITLVVLTAPADSPPPLTPLVRL